MITLPTVASRKSSARQIACFFGLVAILGASGVTWAGPQFPNPVYEVGLDPWNMDKADFDGDGFADLVTANRGSGPSFENPIPGSLSFLRGVGDGTFQEARTIATLNDPTKVLAADVNGDGRADLLYSSELPVEPYWTISLRLNVGNGDFATEQVLATGLFDLLTGDFDGDGHIDLLTTGYEGPAFS